MLSYFYFLAIGFLLGLNIGNDTDILIDKFNWLDLIEDELLIIYFVHVVNWHHCFKIILWCQTNSLY